MKKSNNTRGNPWHDDRGRFCSGQNIQKSEREEFSKTPQENGFGADLQAAEKFRKAAEKTETEDRKRIAKRGQWQAEYLVDDYAFGYNNREDMEEQLSDQIGDFYDNYYDIASRKVNESDAFRLQQMSNNENAFFKDVDAEAEKFGCEINYDSATEPYDYRYDNHQTTEDIGWKIVEYARTSFLEETASLDDIYGQRVYEVKDKKDLFRLKMGEEQNRHFLFTEYASQRIKELGLEKEYEKYAEDHKE